MKEYVFESLDRIKGAEGFELLVFDEGVKVFVKDGNDVVIGTHMWNGLTNYGVMELLNCLDEYFDNE